MATVKQIERFLDEKAPFSLQADFDNAGFLVGREAAEVSRILIALDITAPVIIEAIEQRAELIVAHHPIIWEKRAAVTDRDTTGQKLLLLIEHHIAAICAHTNLDAVEGGVNTRLAALLQLHETEVLEPAGMDAQQRPYGIGRIGMVESRALPDFATFVKQALSLEGVRVWDSGRSVRRVAVGGGACGSLLQEVAAKGCDTFVTSDLKHDLYLEAQHLKINLVDAGHYGTETVICPVLAEWLQTKFPDLTVTVAQAQGEVFRYA